MKQTKHQTLIWQQRLITTFLGLASLLMCGIANAGVSQMVFRYFNDAGSAKAACLASAATVDVCTSAGYITLTYCSNNPPASAGPNEMNYGSITQVGTFWPASNTCSDQGVIQTAYVYPITPCPSGTTNVGSANGGCLPTAYSTHLEEVESSIGKSNCDCDGQSPYPVGANTKYGNPIDALTGNKYQEEVDFEGGYGIPRFVRYYNSLSTSPGFIRGGWSFSFSRRLIIEGIESLRLITDDGRTFRYRRTGKSFTAVGNSPFTLTQSGSEYRVARQDGSVDVFDQNGYLTSAIDINGLTTTVAVLNGVIRITGPFGHVLNIGYMNWSRNQGLQYLLLPDGRSYFSYGVDARWNLTSVSGPDGKTKAYLYEDARYPHALTGIKDELGLRVGTYAYDPSNGLAISTTQAGGSASFNFTYSAGFTEVQSPNGTTQQLASTSIGGSRRLLGRAHSTTGAATSQQFNLAGMMTGAVDESGTASSYTYDDLGRVISTTVGDGSAVAQTRTFSYLDRTQTLPSTVVEGSLSTSVQYDALNRPLKVTAIDGQTTSATTYSYTAKGQLSSISGPRSDVSSTKSFTYNDCSTGAACGQLKSSTNETGQVTSYLAYDSNGRLLKIQTPSGLVETVVYDSRGRVIQVSQTGAGLTRTFSFEFDAAGKQLSRTDPDGNKQTFNYDAQNRLAKVTDSSGQSVAYTYNASGQVVQTNALSASGVLQRQTASTFDASGFPSGASEGGLTTSYASDEVGRIRQMVSPSGVATSVSFDALGRVTETSHPLSGSASYEYDQHNALTRFTAANGASTGFTRSGRGLPVTEVSSDRGTLVHGFDEAGNQTSKVDANGNRLDTKFDALQRLVSATWSDGQQHTFSYDTCANGVGMLCSASDQSGAWSYSYDGLGRLAASTWAYGSKTFTTRFDWTPMGALRSVTYPSGRVVSYTRNVKGQITSVASGGATITSGRAYFADGSLQAQTLGNGVKETWTRDLAGKPTAWTISSVGTKTYSQDADGNLTSAGSMSFGYDSMSRINFDGVGSVALDANGNRKSDSAGAYGYTYGSNRMSTSPGGQVQIDAAGNTLNDPINNLLLSYDAANRLKKISAAGFETGYVYDYKGRRSAKTTAAGTTLYHYDAEDNLIAETDTQGVVQREYVRDGLVPLAQIDGSGVSYLHADHLGTPRYGTGSAGQVVWTWESNAYGSTLPQIQTRTVNLRFPGQYYDAESGFHYNWNRYFDPKSGRYLQSDPIGLNGGANTYAYVGGNPISAFDPTGEFGLNIAGAIVGAISGGFGGYLTSGTWAGTWQGGLAGGVIGLINPFASSFGAYAGGVAANLTGQAVGNNDACKPIFNLNYELALLAGAGGTGGYRTALLLSNPRRSASSFILSQKIGSSATLNKYLGAITEGFVSGITEIGLNSLRDDVPIKDCTCQKK